QKGWMAPPGLALVSVSERAWVQQAKARSPRFYFDWKEAKTWADKGMTPFTPAVPVAFALQEGLRMLEEEGLANVYERHARLARATQAALQALGFQLFAQDGYRSNTVTSALPPAGLDVAALRKLLDTKYGVVIAGGQAKMTGKMVRVGHLGAVAEGDVVQVIWAMEQALEELDMASAWTTSMSGPPLARASWSSTRRAETSLPPRSTRSRCSSPSPVGYPRRTPR